MTEKKTSLPFPTFSHKGKSYFIPNQYDNVSPVDKTNLPKLLARIIPHLPLRFDENDILYPLWPGSKNDMVSLSGSDEWEIVARSIYNDKKSFIVIFIDPEKLVGPAFLHKHRLLLHGEILGLVPKEAIVDVKQFSWTEAETGYDYGESRYADLGTRSFYSEEILKRSKGKKPVETDIGLLENTLGINLST